MWLFYREWILWQARAPVPVFHFGFTLDVLENRTSISRYKRPVIRWSILNPGINDQLK